MVGTVPFAGGKDTSQEGYSHTNFVTKPVITKPFTATSTIAVREVGASAATRELNVRRSSIGTGERCSAGCPDACRDERARTRTNAANAAVRSMMRHGESVSEAAHKNSYRECLTE